jgi:hypothetical protein
LTVSDGKAAIETPENAVYDGCSWSFLDSHQDFG